MIWWGSDESRSIISWTNLDDLFGFASNEQRTFNIPAFLWLAVCCSRCGMVRNQKKDEKRSVQTNGSRLQS